MNALRPLCTYGLGLVALVALVACGGKGANGPGGGASQVEANFSGSPDKVKLDGPAFAAVLTAEANAFTPKTTRFLVYVFAASTDPPPTCEMLSHQESFASMKRGGFLAFTMDKLPDGPGKIDVSELGVLLGDSEKGNLLMNGAHVSNMAMTLRTYDAKSFAGEVATAAGAGTTASGTIAGTVCPPSTVSNANMPAMPADSTSIVDPSAGMSGSGSTSTAAPPDPPPPEPPPAAKPKAKPKGKPKGKPNAKPAGAK